MLPGHGPWDTSTGVGQGSGPPFQLSDTRGRSPTAFLHPQRLLLQPDGPLGPPPPGLAAPGGSRHPSNRICSVMEESAFTLLGGGPGWRRGC